jgi:hypothetical protein
MEEKHTFVWTTPGGVFLIYAADLDEAYRMAVANRVAGGDSLKDAVIHFNMNDGLFEIDGEVKDRPLRRMKQG